MGLFWGRLLRFVFWSCGGFGRTFVVMEVWVLVSGASALGGNQRYHVVLLVGHFGKTIWRYVQIVTLGIRQYAAMVPSLNDPRLPSYPV